MPTYKVTDPTSGRTLKLTGDSPPTEAELTEIFGSVSGKGGPDVDNPADAHGLSNDTKELVAKNLPWMAKDVEHTASPRQVEQASMKDSEGRTVLVNPEASFAPVNKISTDDLTPVPEWRQTAVGVTNKLPEIGQTIGTAAGMASSIPFGGTSSPLMIPAGGAAGRMAGQALMTPLQQLLLPKAGFQAPDAKTLAYSGVKGATGAMTDAAMAGGAATLAPVTKDGPSATLDAILDNSGTKEVIHDARTGIADSLQGRADTLYRRVMKPSTAGNPKDNAAAVRFGVKNRVDMLHPDGMDKVHGNIERLGGRASDYVDGATTPVNMGKVLDPAYDYGYKIMEEGTDPGQLSTIQRIIDDYKAMHPEESVPPEQALRLRRFLDKSSLSPRDFDGDTFNVADETYKAIRGGFKTELEKSVGDPGFNKTMSELGDNLNFRDTAHRSTERMANRSGGPFSLKRPISNPYMQQKRAFAYDKISDVIRPTAPLDVNVSKTSGGFLDSMTPGGGSPVNIGSPTRPLDDLYGVKYGKPLADIDSAMKGLKPSDTALSTGSEVDKQNAVIDSVKARVASGGGHAISQEEKIVLQKAAANDPIGVVKALRGEAYSQSYGHKASEWGQQGKQIQNRLLGTE